MGERDIPLEDLFMIPRRDRRQMIDLEPGDLVVELRIPRPAAAFRAIYLKSMERKAWSFALASVAVGLELKGSEVTQARIVLGGVAPVPWRADEAEKVLKGKTLSPLAALEASKAALAGARPLRDNAFKVPLAEALVKKALTSLIPS
jgi:xanthine dehydrogenase YagS FAD-binding subunit